MKAAEMLTADEVIANCQRELKFYEGLFDKKRAGEVGALSYAEIRRAIYVLREVLGVEWDMKMDFYLGIESEEKWSDD